MDGVSGGAGVTGVLARNWGAVVLRGVVALLFGILVIVFPAISLIVLVLLFGAYSLVDGILMVVWAIVRRGEEPHWISLLVGGLAGIVIGIVTFFYPGLTATVLLYFIAIWAIITGIAQIVAAIRLRKAITGEWLLALAGVITLLFGLFLIARPLAGALAVVIWIGAYAIIMGVVLIGLGVRLRRASGRLRV